MTVRFFFKKPGKIKYVTSKYQHPLSYSMKPRGCYNSCYNSKLNKGTYLFVLKDFTLAEILCKQCLLPMQYNTCLCDTLSGVGMGIVRILLIQTSYRYRYFAILLFLLHAITWCKHKNMTIKGVKRFNIYVLLFIVCYFFAEKAR